MIPGKRFSDAAPRLEAGFCGAARVRPPGASSIAIHPAARTGGDLRGLFEPGDGYFVARRGEQASEVGDACHALPSPLICWIRTNQ